MRDTLSDFRSAYAALLAELYARARADQWALPQDSFDGALYRSALYRFGSSAPDAADLREYLVSLHLADLALAAACLAGVESAWEQFVARFRPELYAAGRAVAGGAGGRELADSLYGELFGVSGTGRERRSLFVYFHGRSKLSTWLRTVLAQRHVDRWRHERRLQPLEARGSSEPSTTAEPDPDRARLLAALRSAFSAALGTLVPKDRLRLSYYYMHQLTLARIGQLLAEHESSVSRKLEKTRRELRRRLEQALREQAHLSAAEIQQCFEYALEPDGLDIGEMLGDGNAGARGKISGAARSH